MGLLGFAYADVMNYTCDSSALTRQIRPTTFM
jgi:hypothetical protein